MAAAAKFVLPIPLDKPKKIGIGWTNFAAVAMETKKGGLIFFFFIPFIKQFS
jgi:hypothetical protein